MPPAAMEIYARLCGWTLARAHARSGDAVAIGAYLGSRRESSTRRSPSSRAATRTRTKSDYDALTEAIDSGRLPAEDA